ncbi:MAG: hypothetical protein AB1544_13850 [Pseudomonadota bacterium]|jgi:hypothetical protein
MMAVPLSSSMVSSGIPLRALRLCCRWIAERATSLHIPVVVSRAGRPRLHPAARKGDRMMSRDPYFTTIFGAIIDEENAGALAQAVVHFECGALKRCRAGDTHDLSPLQAALWQSFQSGATPLRTRRSQSGNNVPTFRMRDTPAHAALPVRIAALKSLPGFFSGGSLR